MPAEMNEQEMAMLLRSKPVNGAARTWRCPPPEALAAYADGKLGEGARQEIEPHIADCNYCLHEVAWLARLQDSPQPEVPAGLLVRARSLRTSPAVAPWFRWAWAAATAAGLVVAASLWLNRPERALDLPRSDLPTVVRPVPTAPATEAAPAAEAGTPPVEAGTLADRTVRNHGQHAAVPSLVFPQEGAVVSAAEVEFRWSAVPQALFYEVRILSAEGDLVWEQRVDGTRTRIPASALSQQRGKIFVSVRAQLPDGRSRKSPVVGFTVRGLE